MNCTRWIASRMCSRPGNHPRAMLVIRASVEVVEVAPDGQSFTTPYTIEFVTPDGTSTGQVGPGPIVRPWV